MKYMIVVAMSATDLEKRVNEFLDMGWELCGGVGVDAASVERFCQAMTTSNP